MNPSTSARMPDGSVVSEAAALVRAALDDHLWNHTLRTHLLAVGWAERFDVRFDREQLALACLFHDLGMVPPPRDPARSFTSAQHVHEVESRLRDRDRVVTGERALPAGDDHVEARGRALVGRTFASRTIDSSSPGM